MSQINLSKIALVFPGQGSQALGMGQEICQTEPDSKNAFHIVANECEFDLPKLAWNGPEEALKRTCHTQPALLATSAACLQALRRYWTDNPLCVAGHSLGELSALWAAEALTLKQTAELTVLRGTLMEASAGGSMAAVLGLNEAVVREACEEAAAVVANYNTPQQQVVSGSKEAVEKACAKLTELKGKVIPLAVSGAFHSPLVAEANARFKENLQQVQFKDAVCPVIQNIDAKAYTKGEDLKQNLSEQMTSSVQWVKSVQTMLDLGAECFIEVGSGKVLSGLIKKIDRSAKVLSVSDAKTLNETLESLGISGILSPVG
ncbi:MAG: ACP S-malonyltransferase [Candidatus Caenarcaniphilales bacterium]|nr:ACP S-malonyltransferase [Candidatus Caenarcaniphilales bacterium]